MNIFAKTTAAAALMGLVGTAAMANSGFGQQSVVMDDDAITIDLVVADADGVVAIYDYSAGGLGDMIGMAEVNAGANADVVVPLDATAQPNLRIAALLFEGEVSTPDMATARMSLDIAD